MGHNDRIIKFFVITGHDDSPFDEDSRNIFFSREPLISEEERLENLGKWAITGKSIVM